MSYDLATIYKEVPIDTNIDSIKKENINEEEYSNILKELEFFSLLKKMDTKEDVKKEVNNLVVINNLSDLVLEDEYGIYLELLGYNYHDAKPLGVSIYSKNHAYYVPFELLIKSDIFADNKKKYTYDLKKMLVVFDKNDIKIDKNIRDLMIEGYLLNKNIKNDIAYLANQDDYDITFYDKEFGSEITLHEVDENVVSANAIKKAMYLFDKQKEFYDELKSEEMESLYNDIELPLVYVLANMEITGFKVDRDYLEEMKMEINEKLKGLEKDIYNISNEEFNISSPKQLADVLFNKLLIPYPKRIKNDNYSTSKDILDKLAPNYEIVRLVLEYRMYSKLYSNYIVGLIDEIKEDGKIHTIFNQTLTRTGRLSSESPNLQNIPIRIEEGRKIRRAFIPSNDSIIISSDYSQIELRVFAHMAKATNMIEAFKNDLDIHAKTASDIYGIPLAEVDKDMRRSAKAVNFGIIYGISSFGLSEDLGINVYEAKDFIDNYLATFPGIKEYMDREIAEAYKNGYVKTLFNRKRIIDELKNKNYLIRSSGERMALNTPIQGTAADIIKMAMIKLQKKLDEMNLNTKMLVQVHDELVFDVPNNEVEIVIPVIRETMENIYKMDVPLKVDIEYGKDWYEAK
jgi:DNA polymerase-1